MKRIVGVAIWLVVLFGVMAWPVVTYNWSLGPTVYEETTITNYDADFTVDDDGDLHATETLTVDFPGFGKHGIFRFFDEADQSATHARRVPARLHGDARRVSRAVRGARRGERPHHQPQDRQRRRHRRPG